MKKIPIVEMEDTNADVTSSIVRLPYCDISDIISWIGERKPLAVIPPYSASASFTARAASMVLDRLLAGSAEGRPRILVAVCGGTRRDMAESLSTFVDAGFNGFAFPHFSGESPITHLFHIAPENMWFHVAGGKPKESALAGKWTWSEEGL